MDKPDLDLPEKKIISLYRNHVLSEQFHSEFKTDLDLERLPSGKFATNELVMAIGAFVYNILRFIGQLGLLGEKSPVRHPGNGYPGINLPGSPPHQERQPIKIAFWLPLSSLPGIYRGIWQVAGRQLFVFQP